MRLEKTDKARDELQGGVRRLGRRERSLLILADGQKTIQDLTSIFKDEAQQLAEDLIRDGYLVGIPLNLSSTRKLQPNGSPRSPEPQPPVAADQFEGKRSLATTRMFLFDLSERMFVARAPEQAAAFREAFRQAKDRESMLSVARDLIQAVEDVAGAERADAIGQRIAMLLPVEE